jgi:hypothetical protein
MALLVALSIEARGELRNYYGNHRQAIRVFGNVAFGDMASEIWVFDVNSTAADNGTTVIKPNDVVTPVPGSPGRYILFEKVTIDYFNSTQVTSNGNALFYLTNDKTPTGTPLFQTAVNIVTVLPIVNDSLNNYTYGWSYNAATKALTVNTKVSSGINVAALGLNLLGAPVNVANGTNIQILVKGT